MSAITGILHFNKEPIESEQCRGLLKGLQNFPADDVQAWMKPYIFFGCHAQWITPESIGERLPYYDYERQLTITADAIIDNREELFDSLLVEKGERKNIPDSQLILLAYSKWGENVPKYLIGDFAFMIWDERNRRLFGARDFSGGRTLYYFRNQQKFAFCTTIKPLFSLSCVNKELNEQWLAEYLAISSVIDTADTSITPYKNIEQLPPAHCISVTEGKIDLTRYCTLATREKLKLKSNEEYVEAFQDVFQKAVNSRLRTHKQVGAHLSGGLDSSSVVSFAAKHLQHGNKPLHTFSYIPQNNFIDYTPKYLMPNESSFIQSTVEYVPGLKAQFLTFDSKNSFSEIDDLLETVETPYKYFENSFWLKGMFEKASEEGIGVLLNGGRGNLSISWGSALDYYSTLLKKLQWVKLFRELDLYSKNAGGPRLRRIPAIGRIAFPKLYKVLEKDSSISFPILINPEFASRTRVFSKLQNYGINETGWISTSNVFEQRKQHFESLFHWNATNTLATKLSLRYGVWKRDPSNDIRVIRFCLSVPEEQYVQKGLDRALIRRATEDYLPDKVRLNQRIKGVQGADWVHRMKPCWEAFIEEANQLSKDKRVLEYMNGSLINQALLKVKEGAQCEKATDPHYRTLMRSLVVYRFLKSSFEGG